jgi:hypothetical protein
VDDGIVDSPGDNGQAGTAIPDLVYIYGVTASGSGGGPSPVSFFYSVSLNTIPTSAIIVRARAIFSVNGGVFALSMEDDYGSGDSVVEWSKSGVDALNALLGGDPGGSLTVHATATFSVLFPPPERTVGLNHFEVWYKGPLPA